MASDLSGGVELMLVGMGTVFVFLTLLVFATRAMSNLVLRFFPNLEPALEAQNPAAPVAPGGIPEEDIAAMSIALAEHLKRHRQ